MIMVKSTGHPQDAKHAGQAGCYTFAADTHRFRYWPEMKGRRTVDTDAFLDSAPVHGAISSFSSLIG